MLNILQISKKDWKGEATEKGRGLGMQVKGLDALSPLQATSHKPGHTESLFYNLSPDGKKVLKLGDKFKKLYDIKTFVASPVFMEALRFDQPFWRFCQYSQAHLPIPSILSYLPAFELLQYYINENL